MRRPDGLPERPPWVSGQAGGRGSPRGEGGHCQTRGGGTLCHVALPGRTAQSATAGSYGNGPVEDGALLHLRRVQAGKGGCCCGGCLGGRWGWQGCLSACHCVTGHVSRDRPSGGLSGPFSQITEGSVCTLALFRSPPVVDLARNSPFGFSGFLVEGSRAAGISSAYVLTPFSHV